MMQGMNPNDIDMGALEDYMGGVGEGKNSIG